MKRFFSFMSALLAVMTVFPAVSASAAVAETKPECYTVNDGDIIAVPETYTYSYSINVTESDSILAEDKYFEQPSDLFIDSNDLIYVADTNNNRVVRMDKNGRLSAVFDSYGESKLNKPEGVFVTKSGMIYIADTGNSRIVELTYDGQPVNEFGLPKSELLADVTVYSPSKLVVSDMGIIYVLMGENIMSITEDNEFIEYFGQSDVGFDFTEWIVRLVASEEQQKSLTKRNAASYTNICLNKDGLIYASSLDETEGQIKVLNSVGNNIYRKTGSASNSWGAISDAVSEFLSGNIMGKSFSYGEIDEKFGSPVFSDICVNSDGIVTVIEGQTGKLYQYDSLGNLLCVFGGTGTNQGEFAIPASLVTDSEGRLYILDSSYGNITVLEPTGFIKLVQKATVAYSDGDYDTANELWKQVLEIDQTYPLAHLGIGNTLLKEGKYTEAMESYRLSNDRKEYSNAFAKYRHEIIAEHFGLTVLGVVAVAAVLIFLLVFTFRRSRAVLEDFEYNRVPYIGFKKGLWLAIGMCYRPGRTLEALKYGRGKVKYLAPFTVLVAVFVTRILFIYTVHYPLQDIERTEVNIFLEFIKLVLPIITWIGVSYLIAEQFGGEATLGETFITSCFSMTPYIIMNLLAAVFSHIMCWDEKGLFAVLVNGSLVWCIFLLIKSCRRMNDCSIGRTVFIGVISLVAMVLVWFICLFGYSLVVCLKEFFADIIQEIKLFNS